MITIVKGDILQSKAPYICHQVNCMGAMGAGVAKQIKALYPGVYEEYKRVCDEHCKNPAELLGQNLGVRVNDDLAIINLFGQLEYSRFHSCTNLSALRAACIPVAANIPKHIEIAMPYRIGCGLAGGDWGAVMDMLAEVFQDNNLVLYKL